MFVVNDKRIEYNPALNKDRSPIEENFEALVNKITAKAKRSPIVLAYPPGLVREDPDNKGKILKPARINIDLVVNNWQDEDRNLLKVAYCESYEIDGDGKQKYFIGKGKTRYEFTGHKRFYSNNKADMELATFLLCISPRKGQAYVEVDAHKNALDEVNKKKRNAELYKMIYIDLKDETVTEIAKAFGIYKDEYTSIDQVRLNLERLLTTNSEKADEFMANKGQMTDDLHMKVMINEAMQAGIITLKPGEMQKNYWFATTNPANNAIVQYERIIFEGNLTFKDNTDEIYEHMLLNPSDLAYLKDRVAKHKYPNLNRNGAPKKED